MERLNQFYEKKGIGYPMGSYLDRISAVCADVFGDKVIKINLPYHDFNCHGPASEIAKDVNYLMPFKGGDVCGQDDTTTLFYGDDRIHHGNYVPFQSWADTFYIEGVQDGQEPTINLVKAPCWAHYL